MPETPKPPSFIEKLALDTTTHSVPHLSPDLQTATHVAGDRVSTSDWPLPWALIVTIGWVDRHPYPEFISLMPPQGGCLSHTTELLLPPGSFLHLGKYPRVGRNLQSP